MEDTKERRLQLPIEWVERIFTLLDKIYKGRWVKSYPSTARYDLEKFRWQTGLADLSSDEIKRALAECEKNQYRLINLYDFHAFAKGRHFEISQKTEVKKSSPEVAHHHLNLIRQKLYGSHRDAPLPPNS